MVFLSAMALRRLRCKTNPATALAQQAAFKQVVGQLLDEALQAEGPSQDNELGALPADARRSHIHWTHVSTNDPAHVQPGQFSRPDFWLHLEKVYQETYPDASSPTGSILMFGLSPKSNITTLCGKRTGRRTSILRQCLPNLITGIRSRSSRCRNTGCL